MLERASLAQSLGRGGESTGTLRSVAEAAQLQGDEKTSREAWTKLLAAEPGNLAGHMALAKMEFGAKDDAGAAKRAAAVFELALVAGNEDMAYDAVKLLLDCEPDVPQHRERLARIQVLRKREDEAARTLVRAARRARDDENFGMAKTWARRALELDATCDDARDVIENLKARVSAAPAPTHERRGPTIKATITGGSKTGPAIEGIRAPSTKRVGNIADRLRNMKLGGGPRAPEVNSNEGKVISHKASSAMNKLRAMKMGKPTGSSESSSGLPAAGEKKVSKGPEAPGEAADSGVSKKASSAMDRLKALRGGGGGAPKAKSEKKVSKGPEAPGEAADAGVSKKASSAMDRLKALRGGGGGGGAPKAKSEKKVSKGPEAPGEAAGRGRVQEGVVGHGSAEGPARRRRQRAETLERQEGQQGPRGSGRGRGRGRFEEGVVGHGPAQGAARRRRRRRAKSLERQEGQQGAGGSGRGRGGGRLEEGVVGHGPAQGPALGEQLEDPRGEREEGQQGAGGSGRGRGGGRLEEGVVGHGPLEGAALGRREAQPQT